MTDGQHLFPAITIPRDEDPGLRIPDYRIIQGGGNVYLAGGSLMRFGEDLVPAWRRDEDFGRWEIDSVSHREIVLVSLDGRGRWEHRTWTLDDDRRIR